MGGQSTKVDGGGGGPPGGLSGEEVARLKRIFNSLNVSSVAVGAKGEKQVAAPYGDFQRYCEDTLDDWLARRVADKLSVKTSKGEELVVPLGKFLAFVGSLLKGSDDEKVKVIWSVAITEETADLITAQEISQYTRSIIESYIKSTEGTSCFKSWRGLVGLSSDAISEFAEFLLSDLVHPGVGAKELIHRDKPSKSTFTVEEVSAHFGKSPSLLALHNSIISQCFKFDVDTHFLRLLPVCHHAQSAFLPEDYTALDLAKVIFLNSHLPAELRGTWRFLFSTPAHGASFAKLKGLIVDKGPTLLILKEAKGGRRVFGAFAADSWAVGPKFFGKGSSFVFHLEPKCLIYGSTGYNDNFQYLNLQQQTLPNGLGMGGQLEYFGLWVDAEFGKGKAAPSCTTFDSPQLASEEDFELLHVEVWGVGPEPKKDEEGEEGGRSILDKDPEGKAMLELLDRGRASDGWREEPQD